MKKLKLIVVTAIFVLLLGSSCQESLSPSIENGLNENVITNLEDIYTTLEELGQVNLEWMAHEGWIHYERIPSADGIIKFTYQERWTHYINDKGECAEELFVIKKTKDANDIQRFYRMSDGTRGELIALRGSGEIPDYADPRLSQNYVCNAQDLAAPLTDLASLREKEDYLVEIRLWKDIYNGVDVVVLEMNFEGEDTNLLAIPSDADGKLERVYYDEQNGNRIRTVISLLYDGDQWQGETSCEERFEYYEDLPESVVEEIVISEKELLFYLEILSN